MKRLYHSEKSLLKMRGGAKIGSMTETKVIRSTTSLIPLRLGELWKCRELLYFLAWRDFKVRYKQTAIGVLWVVFQPLVTMAAFVIFFGRLKGISGSEVPYILFVYSGIVLWHFFSNSINDASHSLISNGALVTKVSFPRIIVPVSSIVIQLSDLFFSGIILVGMLLYFGYIPSFISVLALIPLLVTLFTLATSIGILCSALSVRYRDVRHALPFFIQLMLFLSPIIYSSSVLRDHASLLRLNPLTGIVEGFRALIFSQPFPVTSFVFSLILTCILLVVSVYYFTSTEDQFSDII